MDVHHQLSGDIETVERASTYGEDSTLTRAMLEYSPADMGILSAAGDTVIKKPGNSGQVAQEGSVLHSLNTGVTLQRTAAPLETSAVGDNWINNALSDENSPSGSDSTTFSLSKILGFVSMSQVGSNLELPALNLLIKLFDTGYFLSDDSGVRLPVKLLTLGKLLLDRATILDSASDMDGSIKYLKRAAEVSQGERAIWTEVVAVLCSAHQKRFERYGKAEDLNYAIEYLNQIIHLMGNRQNIDARMIAERGRLLLSRFKILGGLNDLQAAIECFSHAWILIPEEDESRTGALSNLGSSYALRFERLGELEDLGKAIDCLTQAVHLTPKGHPDMPGRFNNLGNSYRCRFERLGELEDLGKAIDYQTQAVHLTPDRHPDMPILCNNLGNSYARRFLRLDKLEDISKAIDCQTQAVHLTPKGHPGMPGQFNNLGNSYSLRFERLGELEDLGKAIDYQAQAVHLAPNGHPDMPSRFNNLGNSYTHRFLRLDKLEDLGKAIECQTQAVHLMPKGHPDMPSLFNSLGHSYSLRFERLGELEDLGKAIDYHTQAVHLTPNGHPDMPTRFKNLGNSYSLRFERLGKLEDMSKAIDCQTQAVDLTPNEHPTIPVQLNSLGSSYSLRFERLGKLEDISKAIDCQTQAVHLTPNGRPDMPSHFNSLGNSYSRRFLCLGELEDLNKAIDCQTQAVHLMLKEHPNMPSLFNSLGNLYWRRFERLGKLEDISKAIDYLTEAVHLTPNGHPDMPSRFNSLGNSYRCRFERLGELEDISKSINCQTQAVYLTPKGHLDMPMLFSNLGNSHSRRFERLGELEDISKAIECQTQAVCLTPNEHPDMPSRFNNLGNSYTRRFLRLGELEDLDKAIDCQTQAVHLTSDEHAHKPTWLLNFGNSLLSRFPSLKDFSDIAGAIRAYSRALELLSRTDILVPTLQLALGQSYRTCGALLGDPQEMAKALGYFIASACSSIGSPSVRLRAARDWASLLSIIGTSSTLPAHRISMLLLPELIWLGTTTARRYESITEVGAVAVEAAAAAISAKEYELALEWLEQGRSIVWTQTLQLRMPYDVLSLVDPILSQQLQHVSRELELASQRTPGNIIVASDPVMFEQATLRHQHLTHQYEKLVAQAQELPGFHDFMLPKKAAELRLAARSGPVVVVNVHAGHCDALILSPQSNQVAHVPLPELSHSELSRLHNLMLTTLQAKSIRERTMARLKELDGDHFKHILTILWHKLVKPVLDFLGYTSKPSGDQLPHITWCTTGALSFLPVHAAGDYDSGGDRIFDFAVTSYTPTLSALLPSPTQSVESASGVLAVGQESTPGLSKLPGTKRELAHIKQRLEGLHYMQLEDSQATPQAVLDAMEEYECVHLACHGSQHADNPTQSCFHLHGGTLTLEQIAQQALKNKRLAFLSACQTAKGHHRMPDEAIHLAAGMLVAGYPSVIATMWSISDCDAPLVADQVYSRIHQGKPPVQNE